MPPAMLSQTVFSPLATILRDRRLSLMLTGLLCLHIGLAALSLPFWECPFLKWTGVPCPGCGLTRASMFLLQGEVQASIHYHAFAPFFILLITMLVIGTLLPRAVSGPLIRKAEILERQTGLTIIILGGLILYWLARLLFLNSSFVQLIRG